MKLTRMFLLFTSIFFITSNIFSQREDIVEQMRKVTHNHISNFQDETFSQDAILNGMLKRTSKTNVLATYEVVDSAIETFSGEYIKKYKYGFDSNGKRTSDLFESCDGTNWVNQSRNTNTYDSNGNITSYLDEY